ncbi:hypothetical protein Y1Q_0016909 [Alligator mississippiensis]|uniref:Uncharacterized protein n=1 Tax=Alligator mississippiensis TaxID=8496 RepID=A0A151MV99_ALLMI|nr:hypothetical protein Y1Q_0016909 [Alligator mississippiensis]
MLVLLPDRESKLLARWQGPYEVIRQVGPLDYEVYQTDKQKKKQCPQLGLERFYGITILGSNSPEWVIADIRAIMAGGLAVRLYSTSFPEACGYITADCTTNVVVVEDKVQLIKILQVTLEVRMFKEVLRFQDQEVFLSYLPLSHIAGQIIDLWLSMYLGDTTWFAQPNALKEKIKEKLKAAFSQSLLGKRMLVEWAQDIRLQASCIHLDSDAVPVAELLITEDGKNIALVPMEESVKKEVLIVSNTVLVSDGRRFLSMLLTLKCKVDPQLGATLDELSPKAVQLCWELGSQATQVLVEDPVPDNLAVIFRVQLHGQ